MDLKIDGYAYANKGEMDEIVEEKDEDIDTSKEESSVHKSSKQQDSKINKSKEEISEDFGVSAEKSENYEREVQDLEASIEKLKEDNELIQKKINIIYEFRKKEGREERNFYKESNINESTYADSLTSTAGLYNDLNSHKLKLDQDLKRYQQSIEEQEKQQLIVDSLNDPENPYSNYWSNKILKINYNEGLEVKGSSNPNAK